MATELTWLPAETNVHIWAGDDWSSLFTFSINLTGATVLAAVVTDAGVSTSITVTNTNLALGQVTLSLNDTQTLTTIGAGWHRWYCNSTIGAITTTYFAGAFEIKSRY